MSEQITLKRIIKFDNLVEALKTIEFRGLHTSGGKKIRPYKFAKFSIATVFPSKFVGASPEILLPKNKREFLFTPQPTIYQNQLEIIGTVDKFLKNHNLSVNDLTDPVEYDWAGRGMFHMLPPVIEKHSYDLNEGYLDLAKLGGRFKNTYIKDARGNLHHLTNRFLKNFHIDEVSKIDYLDIFNTNMPIINYGLRNSGKHNFYIICDGAHRVDYAIEKLGKPIKVILVEPEKESLPLIPYYAMPVSFRPTLRLTSKLSERMYPRLERDKIHLLNDFIRKTLHYDWERAGLSVSKLRSNQ